MPNPTPTPRERPRRSIVVRVARILAGVVGGVSALAWLIFVATVIRSALSSDPAADPHGYAMIFGTVLSVPAGVVAAAFSGFAFPPPRWARGFAITFAVFLGGETLMFVVLYLAGG